MNATETEKLIDYAIRTTTRAIPDIPSTNPAKYLYLLAHRSHAHFGAVKRQGGSPFGGGWILLIGMREGHPELAMIPEDEIAVVLFVGNVQRAVGLPWTTKATTAPGGAA